MPPDRLPPDDPKEWLNRARSNLAQAKNSREEVYLEDLCFNAQQAVEKSLKALLLARDAPVPRTHNIGELFSLLVSSGVTIPVEIMSASSLTEFAVESRYPGPAEPVTDDEYREVLVLAEAVLVWIERHLFRE